MAPTDRRGRDRIDYAEAGAVMRNTIERAGRAALGSRDYAVLSAVLGLTAGYSKLSDDTTTSQVAQLAYGRSDLHGRDRERVRESLNKLKRLELIELRPSGGGR